MIPFELDVPHVSVNHKRIYPLGDCLTPEEAQSLGLPAFHKHIVPSYPRLDPLDPSIRVAAILDPEEPGCFQRPPKKGERYLSGAVPKAYIAPMDMSSPVHIARLVIVKSVINYEITHTQPKEA